MSIEPVLSYSIKDLENISGIKAHTLRIWEQRYNLFEPNRTDTNIRLYSNSDMRKLLNVALLNNNGVKISKIAELSNDQLNVKASEILVSQNNYQNQIEFLVMSMIDMNESKFEEIISENILSIAQLCNHTSEDLLKIPNLGKRSLRDVVDCLAFRGMKLKDAP
jgi:DNA-binding transcriptional MerR regulator